MSWRGRFQRNEDQAGGPVRDGARDVSARQQVDATAEHDLRLEVQNINVQQPFLIGQSAI